MQTRSREDHVFYATMSTPLKSLFLGKAPLWGPCFCTGACGCESWKSAKRSFQTTSPSPACPCETSDVGTPSRAPSIRRMQTMNSEAWKETGSLDQTGQGGLWTGWAWHRALILRHVSFAADRRSMRCSGQAYSSSHGWGLG